MFQIKSSICISFSNLNFLIKNLMISIFSHIFKSVGKYNVYESFLLSFVSSISQFFELYNSLETYFTSI